MRIDNPKFVGELGSFSGTFTGSYQGTGTLLTDIDYNNISGSPTLISSSKQIAEITGSSFISGSVLNNTLTLNQGGGTQLSFTLDTGSASGGSGAGFPFRGNAVITGSLTVSGSNISGSFKGDGSQLTGIVPDSYQLITVTVVAGKFRLNGSSNAKISLVQGLTYRFDTSDSSCTYDTFGIRTRNNTTYSTGVSIIGTAGTAGSYTQFEVKFNTPSQLRYYSVANGNSYGNLISVLNSFVPIFESDTTITGSLYVTNNIGINTITPEAQLHIKSSEDVSLILEADTDDTNENDNPILRFRQDGGTTLADIGLNGAGSPYTDALSDAFYLGTPTNHPIQFVTNDIARGIITSAGKVGINKISPSAQLEVHGIISASSFQGDGSLLTGIAGGSGGGGGGSLIGAFTSSFSNISSQVFTHNLNSRQIIVSVYDSSYNEIIPRTVTLTSLSTTTIDFGTTVSGNLIIAKAGEPKNTFKTNISGSSSYTISHTLQEDYPIVQVYESGSRVQVIPSGITSINSGSLKLDFDMNFHGHVIIKK
jgi:hypothetical protein|tara:strand:+ start:2883 stop:4490 length:1608 start_codon:yes stop_codon:yes gene_type:complete